MVLPSSVLDGMGRHRNTVTMVRLIVLIAFVLTACGATPPAPPASAPPVPPASASAQPSLAPPPDFARLEATYAARLGVYAVDTGSGHEVAYHAEDRFAYASTHKVLTASLILRKTPIDGLNRKITYGREAVVANSPITEKHVATGMTLREIMDAALRYSDNTAANLMFAELGGPPAVGAALRDLGDTTIHVDRTETTLNETNPGDIRDTTTPRAMATTIRGFTLGSLLPHDKQILLTDIMRANTTGAALIRAGVPAGWQVADKTGSADHGTRNDVAVIWPPQRAPIVLVVFTDRTGKEASYDNKLIAEATKAVVTAFP
jgi:beta-lactamase class A